MTAAIAEGGVVRASWPHRERGLWIEVEDAPLHIAQGWRLLDDGAARREVLLAPPAHFGAAA